MTSAGSVTWRTLRSFCANTSIAGLNNAARARNRSRCVIWLVIFAVLSYLTLDGIIFVVKDFISHPYLTSTSLSYKSKVYFPAITVCNHNRIHCINLLSEVIRFSEEEDKSGEDEDVLKTLVQLWAFTGCQMQVCSSIQEMFESDRNTAKDLTSHDQLVVFQAQLNCSRSEFYDEWSCHHLQHMREQANGTSEIPYNGTLPADEFITEAWNHFKCSLDIACDWKPVGQTEYTKPASCPEPERRVDIVDGPGGSDGPPTRRKRSISGPPSSSSGSFHRFKTSVAAERKKRNVNDLGDNPETPNMLDANAETEAQFLEMYMHLNTSVRKNIGHKCSSYDSLLGQVGSFISTCTYRGRDCTDESYWTYSLDPTYGTCYSFNTKSNADDEKVPREASLTGINNGFHVELFLDQDNYMLSKLSKKAGARMVVHDFEHAPYPDEEGVDMMPNTATSAAVYINEIERLSYPYESNCTDFWNQTNFDIEVGDGVSYSLTTCHRLCIQEAILEECGCSHPNFQQELVQTSTIRANKHETRVCSVSSDESNADYTCFTGLLEEFNGGNRTCPCNAACTERQYVSTVSASTWPSNQYWFYLALDLGYSREDLEGNGPMAAAIRERLQQDYARADVYFMSLNVQTVKQTRKYSDTKGFFASLGGALSLYLGVAMVMCFELVELCVDVVANVWGRGKGKGGDDEEEEEEVEKRRGGRLRHRI